MEHSYDYWLTDQGFCVSFGPIEIDWCVILRAALAKKES